MTMSRKLTFRYSTAAVLAAGVIIILALFAQPLTSTQEPISLSSSFLVMLTDPPTVPAGTTDLNITYSEVALHIVHGNDGTTEWQPLSASGTVNLFSLINMSKTIAVTTLPDNSSVDKIQFTIGNVKAEVNGTTYDVTSLSNTLVINIENSKINQTLSGVLIDFNPTLVQIQATDENGALKQYYVLVPSATATIVEELTKDHVKVGNIIEIGQNNKVKLVRVVEEYSKNITIVSATLTVDGNKTSLSVTLKNNGDVSFRVFGLTLHGEFNTTTTWQKREVDDKIHPRTLPFKVNETALVPQFGDNSQDEHDDEDDEYNEDRYDDTYKTSKLSALTLEPGETITLTYSGIIGLHLDYEHKSKSKTMVITPVVDSSYTLRLMGEGYQTLSVTATS